MDQLSGSMFGERKRNRTNKLMELSVSSIEMFIIEEFSKFERRFEIVLEERDQAWASERQGFIEDILKLRTKTASLNKRISELESGQSIPRVLFSGIEESLDVDDNLRDNHYRKLKSRLDLIDSICGCDTAAEVLKESKEPKSRKSPRRSEKFVQRSGLITKLTDIEEKVGSLIASSPRDRHGALLRPRDRSPPPWIPVGTSRPFSAHPSTHSSAMVTSHIYPSIPNGLPKSSPRRPKRPSVAKLKRVVRDVKEQLHSIQGEVDEIQLHEHRTIQELLQISRQQNQKIYNLEDNISQLIDEVNDTDLINPSNNSRNIHENSGNMPMESDILQSTDISNEIENNSEQVIDHIISLSDQIESFHVIIQELDANREQSMNQMKLQFEASIQSVLLHMNELANQVAMPPLASVSLEGVTAARSTGGDSVAVTPVVTALQSGTIGASAGVASGASGAGVEELEVRSASKPARTVEASSQLQPWIEAQGRHDERINGLASDMKLSELKLNSIFTVLKNMLILYQHLIGSIYPHTYVSVDKGTAVTVNGVVAPTMVMDDSLLAKLEENWAVPLLERNSSVERDVFMSNDSIKTEYEKYEKEIKEFFDVIIQQKQVVNHFQKSYGDHIQHQSLEIEQLNEKILNLNQKVVDSVAGMKGLLSDQSLEFQSSFKKQNEDLNGRIFSQTDHIQELISSQDMRLNSQSIEMKNDRKELERQIEACNGSIQQIQSEMGQLQAAMESKLKSMNDGHGSVSSILAQIESINKVQRAFDVERAQLVDSIVELQNLVNAERQDRVEDKDEFPSPNRTPVPLRSHGILNGTREFPKRGLGSNVHSRRPSFHDSDDMSVSSEFPNWMQTPPQGLSTVRRAPTTLPTDLRDLSLMYRGEYIKIKQLEENKTVAKSGVKSWLAEFHRVNGRKPTINEKRLAIDKYVKHYEACRDLKESQAEIERIFSAYKENYKLIHGTYDGLQQSLGVVGSQSPSRFDDYYQQQQQQQQQPSLRAPKINTLRVADIV